MEKKLLADGENLIDRLEDFCLKGSSLTTQIWLSQSLGKKLSSQAEYGHSDVPYIGVITKALKSSNNEIMELTYKLEQPTTNNEKLYLIQHLYIPSSKKFFFFGIKPTEEIVFI